MVPEPLMDCREIHTCHITYVIVTAVLTGMSIFTV